MKRKFVLIEPKLNKFSYYEDNKFITSMTLDGVVQPTKKEIEEFRQRPYDFIKNLEGKE